MATILIVEDERHIAEGIKLNLELKGHTVLLAANGKIGLEQFSLRPVDLIVLDLMMDVMDGHQFLEKLRSIDSRVPVLVLSAKDTPQDKIRCFRQGVDDYLSKPFVLEEFLLRVERLYLRSKWPVRLEQSEFLSLGEFVVNLSNGEANTIEGSVVLTEQELKLLKYFIQCEGQILDRAQLLQGAWGYASEMESRTVDNFVVRLRRYFEPDSRHPRHFHSVRSKGYKFTR
jgi:two-component system alkaline phosphatase synthesis response regulator PhoP